MIEEIRSIILSEGVEVDLSELNGPPIRTKALVGRSTQQFSTSLYSLEYHRMTKFLPEIPADSGMTVLNTVSGETYLIASSYKEVVNGQVSSTICHAMKCNVLIDVIGMQPSADENGNLTNVTVNLYTGVPVYVNQVSAELVQYRPGLFENVEYLVYAPPLPLSLLDRVVFQTEGATRYKVENLDYVEFPGLLVMALCSETRD